MPSPPDVLIVAAAARLHGPAGRSADDGDRCSRLDRLALADLQLLDLPRSVRPDRVLHLHGLEDHDLVPRIDVLALLYGDLDDRSLHGRGEVLSGASDRGADPAGRPRLPREHRRLELLAHLDGETAALELDVELAL